MSIFRPGMYESGDLAIHTQRTYAFYKLLFEQHLFPSWLPEFNAGYGDPHFAFAYFLPYFLGATLHAIGFTFIDSLKILLAVTYILSGIFMYLFVKNEYGDKAGVVSAIFYVFFPYHLVDLHFRVSISEAFSYIYPPLCMLLTQKILKRPTLTTIYLLAISLTCFILTHQIISLMFFPIFILNGFVQWKLYKYPLKHIYIFGLTMLLGLSFSLFYWLPILAEAKYTQGSLNQYMGSFTPFADLLYSPWRYGLLFQGNKGQLSFLIGYTQIFIFGLAMYAVWKNHLAKTKRSYVIFSLFICTMAVYMITPQSEYIWKLLPILKFFQYSYRLLFVVTVFISIIAGILITKYKSQSFIMTLCFLTIFSTILNWGNRRMLTSITDSILIGQFNYSADISTNYLEPSSPIWATLQNGILRKKPLQYMDILNGNAAIKTINHDSYEHKYMLFAKTQTTVKENTLYFPGWHLYVNGQDYPLTYTNSTYPGIIVFTVPKGVYTIVLTFSDTDIRKVTKTISFYIFFFFSSVVLINIISQKINNKGIKKN